MPKDLLRLQVAPNFYGEEIQALGSEADIAWSTGKGAQGYYERLSFSGPGYVMGLELRMLPKGWTWTVPESVIGLQKDLHNQFGKQLGTGLQLGSVTTVRTGFTRSFFARFSSRGRECAGVMFAGVVGNLSNSFRNTIVGYLCASAGSASSLREETIQAMMQAISIEDPYYNGDGFSDEQIDYFKGKQSGVVLRRGGVRVTVWLTDYCTITASAVPKNLSNMLISRKSFCGRRAACGSFAIISELSAEN